MDPVSAFIAPPHIMHPISFLPPELLCEIFLHVVLAECDYTELPSHTPFTLAAVCAEWRAVALAYPLLWRTISVDIDVPPEELPEDHPGPEAVEQSIAEQLVFQLHRSRNAPLLISWLSRSWTRELPSSFLLLLAEHRRWANVEIDIHDGCLLSGVLNAGAEVSFPSLHRLSLSVERPLTFNSILAPPKACAPHLTDLYIALYNQPFPPELIDHIPWAQLKSFGIRAADTPLETILPLLPPDASFTLNCCLSAPIQKSFPSSRTTTTTTTATSPAPTPTPIHTNTSSLILRYSASYITTELFRRLAAPSLTRLTYLGANSFDADDILAFLSRRSESKSHSHSQSDSNNTENKNLEYLRLNVTNQYDPALPTHIPALLTAPALAYLTHLALDLQYEPIPDGILACLCRTSTSSVILPALETLSFHLWTTLPASNSNSASESAAPLLAICTARAHTRLHTIILEPCLNYPPSDAFIDAVRGINSESKKNKTRDDGRHGVQIVLPSAEECGWYWNEEAGILLY